MKNNEFYYDEKQEKFYIQKNGQSFEDFINQLKKPIQGESRLEKINNAFVKISKNSKKIKFLKKVKNKEIYL